MLIPSAFAVDLSGQGLMRHENKNNSDFTDTVRDDVSFTASRFRLNVKAAPEGAKWDLFFQPQFTKVWGQQVSGSNTSGALNDTTNDIHQAYVNWNILEKLSLKAGRQELAYGDQLVIGSVGWSVQARSFDGARLRSTFFGRFTDMFWTKVKDNDVSAAAIGDDEFYGLYHSHDFGEYLKFLDLYTFNKAYHTGGTAGETSLWTFGTRLKSSFHGFDYRVELTSQTGKGMTKNSTLATKQSGNQADLEFGYSPNFLGMRISLEYLQASKDYDQLYPTGHKFLGFADQFSRRNVRSYVAHLKLAPIDKLLVKVDYHMIERLKDNKPNYNFGGGARGATSTSKKEDVATELDLTVKYTLDKGLFAQVGHSMVTAEGYLKALSTKDSTSWSYVMLVANF